MQNCGHCKRSLPREAFAPSQNINGSWCRECFRSDYAAKSGGMVTVSCFYCNRDKSVTARRAAKFMFCSRICKDQHRKAYDINARIDARPARICVRCSASLDKHKRTDAKFCSSLCEALSKTALRVNRNKRDAIFQELASRDGLTCGICDELVQLDGIWPHPASPSIDHIVPVSLGGTDDAANLRLTHLGCNCARGNREGKAA